MRSSAKSPSTRGGAKVMVVDDTAANRDFIATLLRYYGYEAIEVSSGSDALRLCKDAPPDLLITDVVMPDVDGYELIRSLRLQPGGADIPVIVTSAHYPDTGLHSEAVALGIAGVLSRPVEPEAVVRAVSAALGGPAPVPTSDGKDANLRLMSGEVANGLDRVRLLEEDRDLWKSRFLALAETGGTGAVVVDTGGRVMYANATARARLGASLSPGSPLLSPVWIGADGFGRAATLFDAGLASEDAFEITVSSANTHKKVRLAAMPAADGAHRRSEFVLTVLPPDGGNDTSGGAGETHGA